MQTPNILSSNCALFVPWLVHTVIHLTWHFQNARWTSKSCFMRPLWVGGSWAPGLEGKGAVLPQPHHVVCWDSFSVPQFPIIIQGFWTGWFLTTHVTLICSSVFPSSLSFPSSSVDIHTPHNSKKYKTAGKQFFWYLLPFYWGCNKGPQLERS